MLILWALVLQLVLARSIGGQRTMFFFAQEGGSVILPKGKWSETDNVYVKWYYSSTGSKDDDVLLIWKPYNISPKLESTEWQNRISLSEDSSLNILSIKESDFTGVFKCEQSKYKDAHENVYKLARVLMPSELLLLVGEELSLRCEAETREPVPTVRWTKPNGTNYDRLYRNKNILQVHKASVQDSGVWGCEAERDPKKLTAKTSVTVLDLAPSPSVYTSASLGLTATLPCSLSASVSWPKLKEKGLHGGDWDFTPINQSSLQKNQVLTLKLEDTPAWRNQNITSCLSEKSLKNPELSVQIQRVSTDCRGTYHCNLHFRSRTLSTTVTLEVLEVLSSAPAGVALLEGDPLNLNCSLGVPLSSELTVKWTPPKTSTFALPEPHPVNLYLPALSVKDSGQWKCELKKQSKVLTSASVTLKIEKLVDTWVIVTIGSALIFFLLLIIIVVIIRRRSQVTVSRQRKTRYCCCKNPQPKGFYKT